MFRLVRLGFRTFPIRFLVSECKPEIRASKKLDENSIRQAIELSKRGMNSLNVGMKAEAVVLLESAVEMAEKGFPENDQDLLQFYGQLAHTYGQIPDFEKAEVIGHKSISLLKHLVEISDKVRSVQLELARTMKNVAIASQNVKKYEHAELMFRQSLAILQSIHPRKSDADIISTATILESKNVEIEKTSKSIQSEYDGDMASVLHHLASLIDQQSDIALSAHSDSRRVEAERYLRLSIAIREKLSSKLDDLSCALPLHDLGVNLLHQNRPLEAEMCFRHSIHSRVDEKDKDKNHTYIMTLHNLAKLFADNSDFKSSHLMFLKVTGLRKKLFGESLAVAATMESHAACLLMAPPSLKIDNVKSLERKFYHEEATSLLSQANVLREKHASDIKDKPL